MKKAAILTITNSGLYFGNRLQNYALQEALKECGFEVETIQSAKSVRKSKQLSAVRWIVKNVAKNDKRRKCFRKFNHNYIRFAKCIRYENVNENEFADQYDAFVAGSDQVWNPNFHFNSDFEFASCRFGGRRGTFARWHHRRCPSKFGHTVRLFCSYGSSEAEIHPNATGSGRL